MKAENFEKAQRLIRRIELMEKALECYHISNPKKHLFVNLMKRSKSKEGWLEIGVCQDYYIGLSPQQEEDLAGLIKQWIEEDKRELETL